jgi:hypothetical protein
MWYIRERNAVKPSSRINAMQQESRIASRE